MIKSFRAKPQHPLVELRNHILRLKKNESPLHDKQRAGVTARIQKRLPATRTFRDGRYA